MHNPLLENTGPEDGDFFEGEGEQDPLAALAAMYGGQDQGMGLEMPVEPPSGDEKDEYMMMLSERQQERRDRSEYFQNQAKDF